MNYNQVLAKYGAAMAKVSTIEVYESCDGPGEFIRKAVDLAKATQEWKELNTYVQENSERLFEEYKADLVKSAEEDGLSYTALIEGLESADVGVDVILDMYRTSEGMEFYAEWLEWGIDYLRNHAPQSEALRDGVVYPLPF